MKEVKLTPDQRNTIAVMLRRGERISQISSILHVRKEDVESVLEQYVQKAG